MKQVLLTLFAWAIGATLLASGKLDSKANAPATEPAFVLPSGSPWRYVTDNPDSRWFEKNFDDRKWLKGVGGFGDGQAVAAETRTPWRSGRIWLRQTFTLKATPVAPQLALKHRGEVQVYINGDLVADVAGETPRYVPVPLDGGAAAALRPGRNLIAVQAACTSDNPFIDLRIENAADPGAVSAPLYRDPRFDGAADPMVIWNRDQKVWTMFYSQRRANQKHLPGVGYCYGTDIGMAVSRDGGRSWQYEGEAQGLEYRGGRNSLWAPEVIFAQARYHMFVAYIQGVHTTWSGTPIIVHFTSKDLKHWTFSDELPMKNVIDAAVFPIPSGGWRLFYKRDNKTFTVDSPDLRTWTESGLAAGDEGQEGPNVFRWRDRYWMIADVWHGQRVYHSDDLKTWTRQEGDTVLGLPYGRRRDDAAFGRHADVLVQGDRAFIIYFTHPGGDTDHERATSLKRTSVQVAELEYQDGKIRCDRDKPLTYRWNPALADW